MSLHVLERDLLNNMRARVGVVYPIVNLFITEESFIFKNHNFLTNHVYMVLDRGPLHI